MLFSDATFETVSFSIHAVWQATNAVSVNCTHFVIRLSPSTLLHPILWWPYRKECYKGKINNPPPGMLLKVAILARSSAFQNPQAGNLI